MNEAGSKRGEWKGRMCNTWVGEARRKRDNRAKADRQLIRGIKRGMQRDGLLVWIAADHLVVADDVVFVDR
jgi:lauroyl/myristoyl acyltransferase